MSSRGPTLHMGLTIVIKGGLPSHVGVGILKMVKEKEK